MQIKKIKEKKKKKKIKIMKMKIIISKLIQCFYSKKYITKHALLKKQKIMKIQMEKVIK